MQKELDAIEVRRKKASLAANLQQARETEAAGFPAVPATLTLPVRIKDKDAMATEELYQMANPVKYSDTDQQDLEPFISECERVFDVRPVTYKAVVPRVNYA